MFSGRGELFNLVVPTKGPSIDAMPSNPQASSKVVSKSVAVAQERTRKQRIQRLEQTLKERLVDPVPALDALMAELEVGAQHPELWAELHAAAERDKVEAALGEAYKKCATGPRMKRLTPRAQVELLIHAADYVDSVLHDEAGADALVGHVLAIEPDHAGAFTYREQRLERGLDVMGLLELYAEVAATPPKAADILATKAFNRLLQLPSTTALADDVCKKLVVLVLSNPPLLYALERHCRATKRYALACALIHEALRETTVPDALAVEWRERLIDLCLGEANAPPDAMEQLEALLRRDPRHARALELVEALTHTKPVSSRAAAALRSARELRGH
jgi:hypothetical protein